MPLAYLPQHAAQLVGIALGSTIFGFGITLLIRGWPPEMAGQFSPRQLRLMALFQVFAGVAIGLVFFFVNAEGPNSPPGDNWGGTWGIVMLVTWLACLGCLVIYNVRKYRKAAGRSRGGLSKSRS